MSHQSHNQSTTTTSHSTNNNNSGTPNHNTNNNNNNSSTIHHQSQSDLSSIHNISGIHTSSQHVHHHTPSYHQQQQSQPYHHPFFHPSHYNNTSSFPLSGDGGGSSSGGSGASTIKNYFHVNGINGLTEIGKHAVWSLSSAKAEHGVQNLRDNNLNTYWQSNANQPHLVNIQFHKVLQVKQLSIYCNYRLDESYTPRLISVRCGTNFHDLREVCSMELEEPNGWIDIALSSASPNDNESDAAAATPISSETRGNRGIRTNMIQLAILSNHQNGKDTQLRQVKVYGPSTTSSSSSM